MNAINATKAVLTAKGIYINYGMRSASSKLIGVHREVKRENIIRYSDDMQN
jgi:hypothetical protein